MACEALDVIGRAGDALGDRRAAEKAFHRWAENAEAAGSTASRFQALMELATSPGHPSIPEKQDEHFVSPRRLMRAGQRRMAPRRGEDESAHNLDGVAARPMAGVARG